MIAQGSEDYRVEMIGYLHEYVAPDDLVVWHMERVALRTRWCGPALGSTAFVEDERVKTRGTDEWVLSLPPGEIERSRLEPDGSEYFQEGAGSYMRVRMQGRNTWNKTL
jgi:hypothetical protein